MDEPLVKPSHNIVLDPPRRSVASESELERYFMAEAGGCPSRALKLAVTTLETMALSVPRGFTRMKPEHETLEPKERKPEPL